MAYSDQPATAASNLLIHNARMFAEGGRSDVRGYVRVRDGAIHAAESGPPAPDESERRIDAEGRWLLPGLIDLHSHLCYGHLERRERDDPAIPTVAAANARAKLLSGVTTVRDVGGMAQQNLTLKREIEAERVVGPRMLAAGDFIAAPGGHCHYWAREARGTDDVRAAVREQLDAGADLIKLMVSGGVADAWERPTEAELESDEVAAAVDEAHARGARVAAHAHPAAAIRVALEAGCDTIEHATFLEPDVIALLVERGAAVIPTLCVYDRMARNVDGIDPSVASLAGKMWGAKVSRLQAAIAAGVRIGVGTDGGSYFPPDGFVEELRLLVEIGLSPEAVVRAATRGNAEILGIADTVGSIAPGRSADLILVDGEPFQDITALANIHLVVARGRVFDPAAAA